MAASQLSAYNKALRHLEERQLANLTEKREPRYLLDSEWSDAVLTVLQSGYWKHAIRLVKAQPDGNAATNFGRSYSYLKPTDWVRTYQISSDDRFTTLDKDYVDANGYIFSDLSSFYWRYVSNDVNFGMNMSMWGPAFTEYLGIYLAVALCPRIKQAADKLEALEKRMKRYKAQALALDVMDAPPGRIPQGTWVTSRATRGALYPDYDYGTDF